MDAGVGLPSLGILGIRGSPPPAPARTAPAPSGSGPCPTGAAHPPLPGASWTWRQKSRRVPVPDQLRRLPGGHLQGLILGLPVARSRAASRRMGVSSVIVILLCHAPLRGGVSTAVVQPAVGERPPCFPFPLLYRTFCFRTILFSADELTEILFFLLAPGRFPCYTGVVLDFFSMEVHLAETQSQTAGRHPAGEYPGISGQGHNYSNSSTTSPHLPAPAPPALDQSGNIYTLSKLTHYLADAFYPITRIIPTVCSATTSMRRTPAVHGRRGRYAQGCAVHPEGHLPADGRLPACQRHSGCLNPVWEKRTAVVSLSAHSLESLSISICFSGVILKLSKDSERNPVMTNMRSG